jgi:hypothetical protein
VFSRRETDPTAAFLHRLNQVLGNRLFDSLDELQDAALAALDSINSPNLFTYLWP